VKMCPTRRRRVSPTIIDACWAHFHLSAIPDRGDQKVNKGHNIFSTPLAKNLSL
jgi:hypothetical protein